MDGLLFHSGIYLPWLEPNSSAGQLESRIYWLEHEPLRPEIAVLGDSRMGEGFSAREAEKAVGASIHFRNIAVAGSTPRVWYYLLRDLDPDRTYFQTIVLALDHYSDQDGEDIRDRLGDLNYLVGRLRLTDCPEFAGSFHSRELAGRALSGCLLRGIPLREDVQELLAKPRARIRSAKDWLERGHGYLDGYSGKEEDLTGLTVDFAAHVINFPAGAKDWQKDTVKGSLLPEPVPQAGILREYRKRWFGKILEYYAGSKTRIVFIQAPRGPLHPQDSGVAAGFIDGVRSNPQVRVMPAETFENLEQPELFGDGLHLNHAGRPMFSRQLAQKLMEGAE